MRIGYFGGSFDPPHRGHLAVARAVRERFALDRVLLAPTGRQPLKPGGPSAPFADRLAMTTLLCRGEACLEASSIDAPLPGGTPNYTADTLRRLQASLAPQDALFAIVGADAFAGLPQWREMPALFTLAEWIVVSRPGVDQAQVDALALSPTQRTRVHLLNDLADPASATELREALQHHHALRPGMLPSAVLRYIEQHHLYGF